jgi:hypothetical protein
MRCALTESDPPRPDREPVARRMVELVEPIGHIPFVADKPRAAVKTSRCVLPLRVERAD